MKENTKHFIDRRISIAGVVLLLFVAGFAAFRGGSNPKPTITVSLLSEVDLVTNRLATLVMSNAGPGTIAIDIWNTNLVDGWLVAFASTGKVDTTEYRLSIIPFVTVLEPTETLQFVERIPSAATRWQFNTEGRDPSRLDKISETRGLLVALGVLDGLPFPDRFWKWVRGESEWTLDIQSPWFEPDSVAHGTD